MIKTKEELRETQVLLKKFRKSLQTHRKKYGKTKPGEMHYLTEQGLIRQIGDLQYQIDAFSALSNGESIYLRRLSDLGMILSAARISKNLTQADLAKRLKMKQQQIQRYEAIDYKGIAIERMDKVVEELDIDFHVA